MQFEAKFHDRHEAGIILAEQLSDYKGRENLVVLALPRGGVPVGFEVAKELGAPLDVFIVRKLGVPGQEEFAFGAIASGGVRVLNEDLVRALRMPEEMIERVAAREQAEVERRERMYRGNRPQPDIKGRSVIIVDDGLATGATMRAAVKALKSMEPKEIVVAVPVASRQACDEFKEQADVWAVCSVTPEPFYGVGIWYYDFSQTTDEEVNSLLAVAAENVSKERSRSASHNG
jgi:putative phosphoribosyl transferase